MKSILSLFLFFLVFQLSAGTEGVMLSYPSLLVNDMQDIVIQGKVIDSDGLPLPGASVVEKGTSNGVVADFDGNFNISVKNRNSVLVIGFLGYKGKEVSAERDNFDIVLELDATALDQVVVVGYGQQKKINVIGSVESTGSKDIMSAPVSSVSNALAGRLPGATVVQTTGEPGNDAANILIRGRATLGNNQPLVVVDGVAGRDLNSVDSDNIETISVLKDASAAIYGAQAANGVILVTTKKGTRDTAPTFDLNTYTGFLSPTKLPDMTDSATYTQMVNEYFTYKGIENLRYSQEDIEKFASGEYIWSHPNTDWYDEVLKKSSSTRDLNFSVRGGGKSVNYMLSYNSHFADGLFRNGILEYNRNSIQAKVDVELNKYLTLGLNLRASEEKRYGPIQNVSTIFNVTTQNIPDRFAFYPDGTVGTGRFGTGYSPHIMSTEAAGFSDSKKYRSDNTFTANFKVPGVEGLSLSSFFAFDVFFGKKKDFSKIPKGYRVDYGPYFAAGNTGKEDASDFLIPNYNVFGQPSLKNYYDDSKRRTFNFRVNYERSFGLHNVSAFTAYENMNYDNGGINASRRYYVSDQLPYLFAGSDLGKDNSEYAGIDARVNYFGRLAYNYDETYLLEFTFRRDGSLRFSEDSGRWGNFPGVIAGWRVSNEDFWNVGFWNSFKLRASWAQMGNDRVDAFQYLSSFGFGTGGVYGVDRSYYAGLNQSQVANPYITWEVANVHNVGFDAMFFNSRINMSLDVFYERRNNILVPRNASVPQFTGLTLPDENFGIVDNRGFEAKLGYHDYEGDFTFGLDANLAFARNEVVEFDEPIQSVPWQRRTGKPQGSKLLYRAIGIYADQAEIDATPHVSSAIPGDVIIKDVDGDGEITNADREYIPLTNIPEVTYGLAFNVGYKNLQLSGLVSGQARAMFPEMPYQQGNQGNYFEFYANGRWTPDNIYTDKPRAFNNVDPYWRQSYETDYFYRDMGFARLKNLFLSYDLPEKYLNSTFLKQAQLYASADNLFLIYQKEDGIWDPQFGGNRDNYPLIRTWTLGMKLSF